jgi:hypothetical protein
MPCLVLLLKRAKKVRRTTFLLVFLLCALSFGDGTYGWHPNNRLYLRAGFREEAIEDGIRRRAIEDDGVENVENGGGLTYSVRQSSSRRALYEQLGLDASIAGRFAFFKGSASTRYENMAAADESVFAWTVVVRQDFGRFVLKRPRLTEEARVLLEAKSPDGQPDPVKQAEFVQKYGNAYVSGERRGSLVIATFSLSQTREDVRHSLSESIEAGGAGLLWSLNGQAALTKLVESALQAGRLRFELVSIGGPPLNVTSGLLAKIDDLDLLKSEIDTYLANVTSETAVPTEYETTSYSVFGLATDPLESDLDAAIREAYYAYGDLNAKLRRLRSIVRQRNEGYDYVPDERISIYSNTIHAIGRELIRIRSTVKDWRTHPENADPNAEWEDFSVESPEIRVRSLDGWPFGIPRPVVDLSPASFPFVPVFVAGSVENYKYSYAKLYQGQRFVANVRLEPWANERRLFVLRMPEDLPPTPLGIDGLRFRADWISRYSLRFFDRRGGLVNETSLSRDLEIQP